MTVALEDYQEKISVKVMLLVPRTKNRISKDQFEPG